MGKLIKGNWYLKKVGGKFRVRQHGTDEYTKTFDTEKEARSFMGQSRTTIDSLKQVTDQDELLKQYTQKIKEIEDLTISAKLPQPTEDKLRTENIKKIAEERLKNISNALGIDDTVPPGVDLSPDEDQGFFSKILFGTPESQWKADRKKELKNKKNDPVLENRLVIPEKWKSNPLKYIELQVDKEWKEIKLKDPSKMTDEELRNAGGK